MTEKKKGYSGFLRLTPEKKAEIKKRALERRAALSLAYQLGFYVGEEIVHRFLPTISVDSIQTINNISVTCAEGDECRRLNDAWFNKYGFTSESGGDSDEWKALRAYHEMLEEKYLPKTVRCSFQLLNITEENMKEFKEGVGASLWDCDCSHYSTKPEDIEVKADEEGWFTVITLKKG